MGETPHVNAAAGGRRCFGMRWRRWTTPCSKFGATRAASTGATIHRCRNSRIYGGRHRGRRIGGAQRPDKGFAIVGLYIAYIVALPPALLHHGAHGNFSKMVRLAVGSQASEEAARSVAALEHLDRICLETRPDRLDCRQLYVDAVVAARQGRVVRGALKRGSIVLPFCDGCGRARRGGEAVRAVQARVLL